MFAFATANLGVFVELTKLLASFFKKNFATPSQSTNFVPNNTPKIMRYFYSYIILFAALAYSLPHANAQSRHPELKLTPKYKTEKVPDSLNYDERPYFILIDQSEKALAEGDYDAAGLRLVEAMSIEPDNPLNVALLSNLGMIYYYNEQDSMALVTLNEAVRRAPKLIGAREHRAVVLSALGRDREALDDYNAIIEIDSLNTDALFMRAMMSIYRDDFATARHDAQTLARITPLTRKSLLANATLAANEGRNHDAISLYRKLIDIDKQPEYYSALVGCLIAVDNLDEASTVIGKGLQRWVNDPELYYMRAILNHKRYLDKEAHADAQRAVQFGADPKRVAAIFK